MNDLSKKKLFIFDLDGTLTESRQVIDTEMSTIIEQLLGLCKVGIITGSTFKQMQSQFLSGFKNQSEFSNLFLMPQAGSELMRCDDKGWHIVYNKKLGFFQKRKIIKSLQSVLKTISFKIPEGLDFKDLVEDKGGQITFSALGLNANIKDKLAWDPDHAKRKAIVEKLRPLLGSSFDIEIGGTTSIDITQKGINKSFGILTLVDYCKVDLSEAVFLGDALFPGGNDSVAIDSGVECVMVRDVPYTKDFLRTFINSRI